MFLIQQALIWYWFLLKEITSYEIVPLQSGILFQREQNIILSSHTWTVYLHFNLTEIRLGKENLEANLHEVRRTIDDYSKISSSKNKFQDLLESLENVNSRLGSDLQTIIDMIPQSKRRRKRASTENHFSEMALPENLSFWQRKPMRARYSKTHEKASLFMAREIDKNQGNFQKESGALDKTSNIADVQRDFLNSKIQQRRSISEDHDSNQEPCRKESLISQTSQTQAASFSNEILSKNYLDEILLNSNVLEPRKDFIHSQIRHRRALSEDLHLIQGPYRDEPLIRQTGRNKVASISNETVIDIIINSSISKPQRKCLHSNSRQRRALSEGFRLSRGPSLIRHIDQTEKAPFPNEHHLKKRRKRAFTSGGKLIKFLFGNPDEEDRKEIFSNLHKLNINHKNIMMNSKAQSLVISNTEETIAKALHLLQSLSENVTDFNRRFQERVNANDRNMSIVLDKLIHENNIEIALTSLVYFSIETQHAITEFRNAIQTSLSRVLSPILIPSDVLIEILEKIRNCLEKPLELIVPGTHSTVHTYYELSKVSLGVVGEELIITVTLPISDVSGQFQMYKIVSIPWLMNRTDIFIQWEVADYFIIDESRKFHAAITSSQREQCQGKHITICPISTALYTETSPICEFSLFMGEHNQLCMKTVDKLKNNIIKSIPSAWVVSVVQPTSLTLICPNHTIYNEKVEGSFLIKNATECEILSRYFKLQRVIGNNMSIQADFKLLAIPKIHILNEDERIQVIDIGIDDKLTDKIKSVIDQNEKATSFSAMLHEVNKYYDEPFMEPMTAFAGTISLYCLAVGVSVFMLFFKFRKYLRLSHRGTPHVTLQVKNIGQSPREVSV
nr:PREDICTED: uncharacterized protein LOC109037311 [Bemisia tabaci]